MMIVGIRGISITQRAGGGAGQTADKQMIYAAIALVAFVAAVIVPYQRIGRAAYWLFALTIVMLVAVLFTTPMKGAARWFDLGLVRIQPSEIAKLTYILMLGWYLRFGDHYRRLGGLIVPFVLAFLPMGLILIEPDLGTALLFLPTLYFMLFMAGAKLRHLLIILAMGAAVIFLPVGRGVDADTFESQRDRLNVWSVGPIKFYSVDKSLPWRRRPNLPIAYCRMQIGDGGVFDIQPLSLRVLRGHQTDRINGWLRQDDPSIAPREGFQLRWSLITLATGRWRGAPAGGEGSGRAEIFPLAMRQLPHGRTDFILSVIGGRWGMLGCMVVIGLYAVILVFGIEIATITYDPFARMLVIGVLGLLLSQIFINAGMTMGLMPITGMTLPLVSYGGSSLVVNCAALGLLVNVGIRRSISLAPHPFEHGQKREKQTRIESTTDQNGQRRDKLPATAGKSHSNSK